MCCCSPWWRLPSLGVVWFVSQTPSLIIFVIHLDVALFHAAHYLMTETEVQQTRLIPGSTYAVGLCHL